MGVAFMLALFGFVALAVAMRRHHRDLFGMEPSRQQQVVFQAIGTLGLAVSYGHLCHASGGVEGTIYWLCLASLASIAIVVALCVATVWRTAAPRNSAPSQNNGSESVQKSKVQS